MCLRWSEHNSTYIYHHQCATSIDLPYWLRAELLSSQLGNQSRGSRCLDNNVIRLEFSFDDLISYIRMHLASARSSGVICFIGIGLGFGLTSWILYNVYLNTTRKPRRKRKPETVDALSSYDTEKEVMGNGHGISAGIELLEEPDVTRETHIRHRCSTPPPTDKCITASIVESDSGAYISRCAVTAKHQTSSETQSKPNSKMYIETPNIINNNDNHKWLEVHAQDLVIPMNDSGYLDSDIVGQLKADISSDSLMAPSVLSAEAEEDPDYFKYGYVSSVRSSISDQAMHDLASEYSSCKETGDQESDEDVINVEIYEGDTTDQDEASTDTLIGSLLTLGDKPGVNSTDTSDSTDLTINTSQTPDRVSLYSRLSDTRDSWTDSSDFWRELDELSSPYCVSPQLLPHRSASDNAQTSSNFSSPIFVPKPNHSRTSSITSADIDLETIGIDLENVDDIERMELDLIEIRQEICEIEEKLNDMMAVDTTNLYFNVDNLKKLTEVVLSADEIELTSNEIAKAFHILRKYRYTFSTPDKKPTFTCKEAEQPSQTTGSAKRSLPYLDLAVSTTKKSQTAFTNASSMIASKKLNRFFSVTSPVVKEWDIHDFCYTQSVLQQGYEQLTEEFDFTAVSVLKLNSNAFLAAVYLSMIIHGQANQLLSMDGDKFIQHIAQMTNEGHEYLKAWDFSHTATETPDFIAMMEICITTLLTQTKRLMSIEDRAERKSEVLNLFNIAENSRTLILEGIKLFVYYKLSTLYEKYVRGDDFPLYTWLLFARETSENPRSYFSNHLQPQQNLDIDQIDTDLTADALGVQLQTFRLTKPGRDDFMMASRGITCDNSVAEQQQSIPLAIHSSSTYAVLY